MMKLCIGSANSETTCLFLTNHANRQCVNGWCGYDRLPLALPKKSFIFYSVVGQINCHFILYRTNVCLSRLYLNIFQIFFEFRGILINLGKKKRIDQLWLLICSSSLSLSLIIFLFLNLKLVVKFDYMVLGVNFYQSQNRLQKLS